MKENVIKTKSFELAKEIVLIYQYLTKEKNEFVLSKQILKSGTSVGANVAEGAVGESRRDFTHKISIAYKEARETDFWLKLLCETGHLASEMAEPALKICDEVLRILYSILRTSSRNK
jgi:four helix bundle protein